jgi:hypothetical protein
MTLWLSAEMSKLQVGKFGSMQSRMEVEFQHGRRFSVGWRIFPLFQRLQRCFHEHRMPADDLNFFDLPIDGDNDLDFDGSGQPCESSDLRVFRDRLRNRFATLCARSE